MKPITPAEVRKLQAEQEAKEDHKPCDRIIDHINRVLMKSCQYPVVIPVVDIKTIEGYHPLDIIAIHQAYEKAGWDVFHAPKNKRTGSLFYFFLRAES